METLVKPTLAESIDIVKDQLTRAADQYISAIERITALQSELFRAELALQNKEQQIIAANAEDPKALGSNEAARKAAIAAQTQAESANVKDYELKLLHARMESDIAKVRLDQAKTGVRLLELYWGRM